MRSPRTSEGRNTSSRPDPGPHERAGPDRARMSQASKAAIPQRPFSRRQRQNPPAASRRRAGLLFTLPVLALVSTLLLVPVGQTAYYSFTNWDGFTSQWIGFSAYPRLFNHPEFVTVLEHNSAVVLAIPVALALPRRDAF